MRKLKTLVISLISVGLIITASLAACSKTDDQNSNPGTLSDNLSIGLVLAPTNLDIRRTSGAALEQVLLDNVYQTLLTVDENAQAVDNLSRSHTVSPDALVWTFELKDGIKFSDGATAGAEDFVRSIQSVIDDKLVGYQNLSKVKSITSQSNMLKIELTQPDPELAWTLSGRAGVLYPTNLEAEDAKTNALGSGPYTVGSYDGKSLLTLKRNENFWDKDNLAQTQTINIHYIPDAQAGFNAFTSGEIDILAPMKESLAQTISSDESYRQVVGEGSDKFELAFNNKNEKLKDLAVRQAIRHAINHDEFISSRGTADENLGGPITKLEPGYEDLTSLYPYDVSQSADLLQGAGYSTDRVLHLTLDYPADIYGAELGQILTSQFQQAGIELEVHSVDFATWLEKVYKNHDYELTIIDNNEPRHFYNWANPDYYYQYDSKEVQDLYAKSQSAATVEEERELLAQAARKVSEDAAADWLFNYRTTTVMKVGVEGYRANFNQSRLPLSQISVRK